MPESESLEFIPLHFGDRLKIVNPRARLGVITLWSKIDYVVNKLQEIGVDLNPVTSKIAVIGNLYGNGIPHLLRNLLNNPQIRDLLICGTNKSMSKEHVLAFFDSGIEEVDVLGEVITRIRGTDRTIDPLVRPEMFTEKPRITCLGELKKPEFASALKEFIDSFQPPPIADPTRIDIPLPEVRVSHYPSCPLNHNVIADTPLAAWRELVFRIVRFGRLTHLRKGDRQELLNVRAVITNPQEDKEEDLREFGFSLDDLRNYQKHMLEPELPEDQSYTYGNRIRSYFGFDALEKFVDRLRANPEDRDCYLALWDSRYDIDADDSPCLVSLFFRFYEGSLQLTAVYRTHNALDAWLKNVYGLINVQKIVADKLHMRTGNLTVISHSISVDTSKYDFAQRVAKAKGFRLDLDPNGDFTISVENGEIVARHFNHNGNVIHEYRAKHAERLQHEINRDCAISDVGHAMYIGRQLAKAEMCLKTGDRFDEE